MTDQAEVKLGSDASQLTNGVAAAAKDFARQMAAMSKSMQQFSGETKGHVTDIVEHFRTGWASLAGILAGGLLWHSSIEAMLKMEDAVRGLSIVFGMSAEQATKLAVNLKVAGISAESFEQMAFRVGRVLKTQSEEFDRLGVVTKDTQGNLLPMDAILRNIYTRMLDFKSGTDQAEFALSTVGRNAKDFATDMDRLSAATERADQLMRDLNIEMGPDRVAQIERYRQDMNAFGVVLETIGEKTGETVLPDLERLAQWFNTTGPKAIEYILIGVKSLVTALQFLGMVVSSTMIAAAAKFENFGTIAVATGKIVYAQMTGQWLDIGRVMMEADAKVAANNKLMTEAIVENWSEAKKRIDDLWSESGGNAARFPFGMHDRGEGYTGKLNFTPKPTGQTAGPSVVDEWKQKLEQMKMAQRDFHELSKADEAAYWQDKLRLVKAGTKEYNEVYSLMYQAAKALNQEELQNVLAMFQTQIDAAKNNEAVQKGLAAQRTQFVRALSKDETKEYQKAKDEEIKIAQAWAEKTRQIETIHQQQADALLVHQVTMASIAADQDLAMRRINSAQRIALERNAENQLYAIHLAGMQAQLKAEENGPKDPKRIAELNAQIQSLELQHQERLTQIDNSAVQERNKVVIGAQQAVEDAFGNLIEGLATGTKSLKQGLLGFFNDLDKALVKLAADALKTQLFGAGSSSNNWLGGILSSMFGGSGGAAPIAISPLASGTDYVPHDMVALIHKGEAVIPASQNRGGASGGTSVTNHFTLNGPADRRTQDQIAGAVMRGLARAGQRTL